MSRTCDIPSRLFRGRNGMLMEEIHFRVGICSLCQHTNRQNQIPNKIRYQKMFDSLPEELQWKIASFTGRIRDIEDHTTCVWPHTSWTATCSS